MGRRVLLTRMNIYKTIEVKNLKRNKVIIRQNDMDRITIESFKDLIFTYMYQDYKHELCFHYMYSLIFITFSVGIKLQ